MGTGKKQRFLTLELNPDMTDAQERLFKESIADRLNDLRYKDERGLLIIPKIALKIDSSGIIMPKKNIVHSRIINLKNK